MIQTRSKIFIKDNSGIVQGRVVNGTQCVHNVGRVIKLSVTKAKSNIIKQKQKTHTTLQDALIVQTRKSYLRLDGSSVRFNGNVAVILTRAGKKAQFWFKRINTAVPIELKKHRYGSTNFGAIIKLAKNQI